MAGADQVYNDVDGSIDATVESIVLEVGDTDTVGLYIEVQNGKAEGGGGESGCNLKGEQRLVLNIVNSVPGAVSVVSPGAAVHDGDNIKVLMTVDCEDAVDGQEVDLLKVTLRVDADAATAANTPAVISFTRHADSTAVGVTTLDTATFDVTVTQPVDALRRGAPRQGGVAGAFVGPERDERDSDISCRPEMSARPRSPRQG